MSGAILQISDILCRGIPPGKSYLMITVGGRTKQTSVRVAGKLGSPSWNDSFSFPVTDTARITIQVYIKHGLFHLFHDTLVGELRSSLEILSVTGSQDSESRTETITQKLYKEKNGNKTETGRSIQFKFCLKSKPLAILPELDEEAIDKAKEDLKKMDGLTNPLRAVTSNINDVDEIMKAAISAGNLWAPLLQHFDEFMKAVDVISELHPYVAMAWAVISQPLKAIIRQSERDREIYSLLETMTYIYKFILYTSAGPLQMVEAHRETTRLLCQQTTECALFISEYASQVFAKRMITSPINGFNDKVTAYRNTFATLKENFLDQGALLTEIIVFQISAKTDNIMVDIQELSSKEYLDSLPYAHHQRDHSACDIGTRQAIIGDIMTWFAQPLKRDARRVFWLHGIAGCGKSTIAQSVFEQLKAQSRSVAFFFDASRQAEAGPNRLFSTISRDLADLNAGWKASLVAAVKGSVKVRDSSNAKTQFENLLLRPAQEVQTIGPILIIIDALDESGSRKERAVLLQTLTRLSELPIEFRFLITSRPEPDIFHAFHSSSWVYSSQLDLVDQSSTNHDIRLFVYKRLSQIPELKEKWDEHWIDEIINRSGQLFQWAFTACEYVSGDGSIGCDPIARLNELVTSNGYSGLDGLYKAILDRLSTFQPGDETSLRFQLIMGRILSVREPLSISALSALWFDAKDRDQVKNILSPLGSLLRGVSNQHEPIQPLHTSFIDFLIDKTRSGRYWIDLRYQDKMISRSSLREMHMLLKFNICNLDTSYKLNRDVVDLDLRLNQYILPHLSYVCRSWVDHLSAVTPTSEWCDSIHQFLKSRLLFWIEVLSLLKRVDRASYQLSMLKDWLKPMDGCEKLKRFVSDALRFVDGVAPVLRQSTPHLYLSALTFIPRDSPLSELYLPAFPRSLYVEDSDRIQWPQILLDIVTPSDILTIALSPDGKCFASGSDDGTWSTWDRDTGNPIIGPVRAHPNTNAIESIAFSPNGRYVATGSQDNSVKIWDVNTGEKILSAPLSGHDDTVSSVAFSPDGMRIVTGSYDQTIRIWDWRMEKCIATLSEDNNSGILSIAISPDGKYIASGSQNQNIIIWDVDTESIAVGPFKGHKSAVNTVAFSPNGKRLVSGSDDNTVALWDVMTGKCVLGPLVGHTDLVFCVDFSPNGHWIVSGSRDSSVRVWNADTGELVARPLLGHTNTVYSVVFSRDGKHVASGAADGTVKVWGIEALADKDKFQSFADAHTQAVSSVAYSQSGEFLVTGSWDWTLRLWKPTIDMPIPVGEPFRGHTSEIFSCAFSPNGKSAVSGSNDNTVRIWNLETREHKTTYSNAHTDTVHCLASSPDGKYIISGSWDETIKIWDIKTARPIAGPFVGHTGTVTGVAFSPNGERAMSCSSDNSIRIWDVKTTQLAVKPLVGHTDLVSAVVFSPDGKLVISASSDKTIRIWDAITGDLAKEPIEGHSEAINCLAISYDGNLMVSGSDDATLKVWDVETGKFVVLLSGHDEAVQAVAFSPNGRYISSGSDDETLRLWDPQNGNNVLKPFHGHDASVFSVAFSPDSQRTVSGSDDGEIIVWEVETGGIAYRINGHNESIYSIIFSMDGQYIISGSEDSSFKIWNANTGKLITETETTHRDTVNSVAFSPDGTLVVSGSSDESVRLWAAQTGELIGKPFLGHTDYVNSVTFSPNGQHIASGSGDGTVRIWNIKTHKLIAKLSHWHADTDRESNTKSDVDSNEGWETESDASTSSGEDSKVHSGDDSDDGSNDQSPVVRSIAYSPNGQHLISGLNDGTMELWDTETWSKKPTPGRFDGHTGAVLSIQFSSDGQRIISASKDKTIRIWDVESGECVAGPFYGHNEEVLAIALSPDGRQFVSGSRDNAMRVWNVPVKETIENDLTLATSSNGDSTTSVGPNIRAEDCRLEDGWMRTPRDELLFWIPPDYCSGIWLPTGSNTAVIARNTIRLDISRFAHGAEWAKCFDQSRLLSSDSE